MTVVPLARRLAELRPHDGSLRACASAPTPEARVKAGEPSPETDIRERIEEAFARGRAEAAEAARAELERALCEEKARSASELSGERERWAREQADVLAARLGEGLLALEAQLQRSAASVLDPVVAAAIREQALRDLGRMVDDLVAKGSAVSLKVSGPSDLLAEIQQRLGFAGPVEFIPADGADLKLEADETLIETRLRAWSERLKELRH